MPSNHTRSLDLEKLVRAEIASRMHCAPESISLDAHLQLRLGMTSLEVVELIQLLNEKLRVEAFETRSINDLRTVGDLCRVFNEAIHGTDSGGHADAAVLHDAASRVRARRARLKVNGRKD